VQASTFYKINIEKARFKLLLGKLGLLFLYDSRESDGLPDTLEQDDPMPCSALARKRTP
jgi:hypothetical protein